MEYIQSLLENSQFPILTALLLGLLTAVSPCPLAMNITAIGFIGKDITDKRRVFYSGLIYTLGRVIGYTSLGVILYLGAEQFKIESFFKEWGEKILFPAFILIGLFMLDIIKLNFSLLDNVTSKYQNKKTNSILSLLLMGIVFSLAFCPYSGVVYFGMLMPITISSASGLYLPVVFAIATGVPVIIFAWLLAFSVGSVGKLYNNIKKFEFWFRKIVAITFIVVGVYYTIMLFIK